MEDGMTVVLVELARLRRQITQVVRVAADASVTEALSLNYVGFDGAETPVMSVTRDVLDALKRNGWITAFKGDAIPAGEFIAVIHTVWAISDAGLTHVRGVRLMDMARLFGRAADSITEARHYDGEGRAEAAVRMLDIAARTISQIRAEMVRGQDEPTD